MNHRLKRWEKNLCQERYQLIDIKALVPNSPVADRLELVLNALDQLQNEIGRLLDDAKEVSDLNTARKRYLEAEAKLESIRTLSQ